MAENNQNRGGNQGGSSNRGDNQGKQGDTSKRGFASMDEDKQKEIASKGGKASHKNDDSSSNRGGGQSKGGNR